MIQTQDLEKVINHIIDLAPPSDISVVFGFLTVIDNPVLMRAVTSYVTKVYDILLQSLELRPSDRIALQMQRCFTEEEYYSLFTARTTDFRQPIFKTLLITNQNDRLLFTRNRTASYEAFVALLESWSEVHNTVLNEFLYENEISTTT